MAPEDHDLSNDETPADDAGAIVEITGKASVAAANFAAAATPPAVTDTALAIGGGANAADETAEAETAPRAATPVGEILPPEKAALATPEKKTPVTINLAAPLEEADAAPESVASESAPPAGPPIFPVSSTTAAANPFFRSSATTQAGAPPVSSTSTTATAAPRSETTTIYAAQSPPISTTTFNAPRAATPPVTATPGNGAESSMPLFAAAAAAGGGTPPAAPGAAAATPPPAARPGKKAVKQPAVPPAAKTPTPIDTSSKFNKAGKPAEPQAAASKKSAPIEMPHRPEQVETSTTSSRTTHKFEVYPHWLENSHLPGEHQQHLAKLVDDIVAKAVEEGWQTVYIHSKMSDDNNAKLLKMVDNRLSQLGAGHPHVHAELAKRGVQKSPGEIPPMQARFGHAPRKAPVQPAAGAAAPTAA